MGTSLRAIARAVTLVEEYVCVYCLCDAAVNWQYMHNARHMILRPLFAMITSRKPAHSLYSATTIHIIPSV